MHFKYLNGLFTKSVKFFLSEKSTAKYVISPLYYDTQMVPDVSSNQVCSRSGAIWILCKSVHVVNYVICIVCTRQSSWNANSHTLETDRPQRDLPVACVIAQHYSSTTVVSLHFHTRKENFGAHLKVLNFIKIECTVSEKSVTWNCSSRCVYRVFHDFRA